MKTQDAFTEEWSLVLNSAGYKFSNCRSSYDSMRATPLFPQRLKNGKTLLKVRFFSTFFKIRLLII